MELQSIRCSKCGKKLTEAIGEVKMPCKKCGSMVHVMATTNGVYNLLEFCKAENETVIK